MARENYAVRLRRQLISYVARLAREGRLEEKIDSIPYDITSKGWETIRCCIHHDRALLRLRLLSLLGFSTEGLSDVERPLREYLDQVLDGREPDEFPLSLMTEACNACTKARYVVTDACQGCLARPCKVNCPKGAVSMRDDKAHIDPDLCMSCGLCEKSCAFHAIIKVPVPCEEACPVGAIHKGADGVASIDEAKCILCGKCLVACPFGAPVEKSEIVRVLAAIGAGKRVIALVAPAAMVQFPFPAGQFASALEHFGFARVVEVASAADRVAAEEAAELVRLSAGDAGDACDAVQNSAAGLSGGTTEDDSNGGHAATAENNAPAGEGPTAPDQAGGATRSGSVGDAPKGGAAMDGASANHDQTGHLESSGGPVLATSCCPSWVRASAAMGMAEHLSSSPSPMILAGMEVKAEYPDAFTVFIGPCLAKRWEAHRVVRTAGLGSSEMAAGHGATLAATGSGALGASSNHGIHPIDAVLTSEEVGAMLMAASIQVNEEKPKSLDELGGASRYGRGFAATQGVSAAVLHALPGAAARTAAKEAPSGGGSDEISGANSREKCGAPRETETQRIFEVRAASPEAQEIQKAPGAPRIPEVATFVVSGITKDTPAALSRLPEHGGGLLVEVMACEGGCVNGPCAIAGAKAAAVLLERYKAS